MSTPSVSLMTAAAGARNSYTVTFATSSTGGLSFAAGSHVTMTFPAGTDLSSLSISPITDTTTSALISSNGSGSGQTMTWGFNNGAVVNAGDTLRAVVNGAVNPAAGGYTLSVSTTADTTPATSGTYTIVAAQTISTPAVTMLTPAAGARDSYTVTFTTSSTGTLSNAAGSRISMTFPAGTDLTSLAVSPVTNSSNGGSGVSSNGSVSGQTVSWALNNTVVVNAGSTLKAVVNGAGNPPAGGYTLSVATTSDVAPVASGGYTIVAGQSITSPAVTMMTAGAGARNAYTISFATSSTGAMSNASGSRVTMVLPAGTDISNLSTSPITDTTTGGNTVSSNASTVNAGTETITWTFNNFAVVNAGDTLQVAVNGAGNPSPGSYTLTISTTSDLPSVASGSYTIVAGQSVSTPAVTLGTPNAGAVTNYTVTFDTSSTGALSNRAGSKAMVTFPAGTGVPGTLSASTLTDVTTGNTIVASNAVPNSSTLTVTWNLNNFAVVNAGDTLRGLVNGITNPATSACYTLTASTTSDLPAVPSDPYAIGTSAPCSAQLSIVKAHTGDFVSGSTGTYTLTVSNGGALATSGTLTVTDTLPNGETFASGSGGGFGCSAAGQAVTCTSTTSIAASGQAVITLTVNVTAAGGTVLSNMATVSPNGGGSNTDVVTVSSSPASLAISKAHTGAFVSGSNGTYTLTVSNTGGTATSGTVTVTDTLPSGLGFVSGSGGGFSCSAAGQAVTCTSTTPISGNGGQAVITLTVSISAAPGTVLNNSATVGPNGGTSNTDTVTVSGTAAALTISKAHTGAFVSGSNGTYTLTVTNTGGTATSGTVTVTDTLPSGLSFVSGSGGGFSCSAVGQAVTCTSSTAIAGSGGQAVITLTVSIGAAPGTVLNNSATVGPNGGTSNTDTVTVSGTPAALTIAKAHTGSFVSGSNGTYTLTVTNTGGTATSGTVTVTDTLQSGLSFVSGSGGGFSCSAVGQAVTCTSSTAIAGSGGQAVITLTVGISAAPGTVIDNTAAVSPSGGSSNTDQVTVSGTPAALTISKAHSGSFDSGAPAEYTLTVTNTGGTATSGTVTVSDTLQTGLSFVSGSGGGFTCSAAGQVVTCTSTTPIAGSGGQAVITLTVMVGAPAGTVISNTASVGPNGGNSNTDQVTVSGVPTPGTCANPTNLDLRYANLYGENLSGMNLAGADLTGANLSHANLSHANLCGATLNFANLSSANLSGADLTDAVGSYANLNRANLSGADLTDVQLPNANLNRANLSGADLTGALLTGSNLNGVTWSDTTCPDGTNSNSNGGTCVGHL